MQLTEEVNAMSRGVERTLLSIDRQKLKADQWETYQTIHSFLTQAREALTIKDFQQALNLVQKAHVLSNELSRAVR
jgi:electron transfer flavoprotein alpha/beta subunit